MLWSNLRDKYRAIQVNVTVEDIYIERIDEYLDAVKDLITDSKEVLIFWAPGQIITTEQVDDKLAEFQQSIPNPVIFCLGCLAPNDPCYFEYQSAEHWHTQQPTVKLTQRSKKFLSIGTKDYPQRKFILSSINNNNSLSQGYVSYTQLGHGTLSGRYSNTEKEYIHNIANQIDHLLPIPSLDDSEEWTRFPSTFMLDSYLNVITDTYFETPAPYTFVSEKVFNAITHGQMFIMLSPPGTLKYLRSIGYQTFGDYIDESYDDITNDYKRLLAVTKSLTDFINLPLEQIHEIYTKCFPIVMHNQNKLIHNTYFTDLCNIIDRAYNEKI